MFNRRPSSSHAAASSLPGDAPATLPIDPWEDAHRGILIARGAAIVSVFVALLGILWSALDHCDASVDRDAAIARSQQITSDVESLLKLRERSIAHQRSAPAPALLSALSTTLAACGIPADCLTSASPNRSVVSSASGRVEVDATQVTLQRLTLSELGSFLAAWQQRHPEHIPASIEIIPMRIPEQPDRIRAQISLIQVDEALVN
jgi:hypothetical protein